MNDSSHLWVTAKAFEILFDIDCNLQLHRVWDYVATEASKVDHYKDLEFIDVEGLGRGHPHDSDDHPHYVDDWLDKNFTAFNHFIDIKKEGDGQFDDFDGYSYYHGSACKDQFQTVGDAYSPSTLERLLAFFNDIHMDTKVDKAINRWLNDEYVHAPGHGDYDSCSPSIENYSFFTDKGKFNSVEEEARERFPLASFVGKPGKGIPYSTFMPIDNMARYWYQKFQDNEWPDVRYLGPIMHAIQDASIPHHAAGYNGNWHQDYEGELAKNLFKWMSGASNETFCRQVKSLFELWNQNDISPPQKLDKTRDWNRKPAKNWRIDMLVTWMAINAYRAYDKDYGQFKDGYLSKPAIMQDLLIKATALCVLVLHGFGNDLVAKARINAPDVVKYKQYEEFASAKINAVFINISEPVELNWSIEPLGATIEGGEKAKIERLVEGRYKIKLNVVGNYGEQCTSEKWLNVNRITDPEDPHHPR